MQLLETKVDCRGSQILNMQRYHEIVCQRRLMALCIVASLFSIIAYTIAVFLPDWALINFTNTHFEHISVQLGIWGEWRLSNTTQKSEWIPHFPELASHRFHRLAGVHLKHYYRAQAAFCVISFLLMLFTNGMAMYSFLYHRYMFKRFVSMLYLFTAMCIIMTIEILINSVDEWNIEVAHKMYNSNDVAWDYSAERKLGIAVILAWIVVVVYIISSFVFFFSSHKQKGSRAATAEFEIEDRPIHVGRL